MVWSFGAGQSSARQRLSPTHCASSSGGQNWWRSRRLLPFHTDAPWWSYVAQLLSLRQELLPQATCGPVSSTDTTPAATQICRCAFLPLLNFILANLPIYIYMQCSAASFQNPQCAGTGSHTGSNAGRDSDSDTISDTYRPEASIGCALVLI